jgi:hypothetical protein
MGISSSASIESDLGEDQKLSLVLAILPQLGEICNSLTPCYNKRKKEYSYLVNIEISVGILLVYLKYIEKDGDSGAFQPQVDRLARCLEAVFSDTAFESRTSGRSTPVEVCYQSRTTNHE